MTNPNDPGSSLQATWAFFSGTLPTGLGLADFLVLKINGLSPSAIYSGGTGGSDIVTLTYPALVHTNDPWSSAGSSIFPPDSGNVTGG